MKDGKFEASDFKPDSLADGIAISAIQKQYLADLANALLPALKAQWLEELLRDAPVVYGKITDRDGDYYIQFRQGCGAGDTHRARLICIEVIK